MRMAINILRRHIFSLLLGCFIAALPITLSTASQDRLYDVDNQLVDVTGENPVLARESAIIQAQRQAFDVLAQRLLPEAEYAALPNFSDDVVASLVKDFSVKNEQISSDRYKANFTVRFDGPSVERIFGLTGIHYSDTEKGPVIMLPFLQIGSRLVIWEEPNPWREVWQEANLDEGLVPIRVPLGDIADMSDVPDASIFSGQAGNLISLSQRYGGDSIFLAVAQSRGAALEATDGLLVTLYATSGQDIKRVDELTVPAGENASFLKAMQDVVNYLRNDWKRQTVAFDVAQAQTINVQASFNGLAEWIDIKQRLEGIALVEAIRSDSMTHNQAELTIEYTGSLDGLRGALGQSDLFLSETVMDGFRYALRLGDSLYN